MLRRVLTSIAFERSNVSYAGPDGKKRHQGHVHQADR